MKTNHQRGFVDRRGRRFYAGWRWFEIRSYFKGIGPIGGGEPGHGGHRQYARIRHGAKRRIHSLERQRLKRIDLDA